MDTSHVFNVKIVDGGKAVTQGTLSQAPIKIHEYRGVSYLYAITHCGCDVVLRVQWLKIMGPILWDFDKLYMQFTKDARIFCITSAASHGNHIEDISTLQMQKLLNQETKMGAVLFQVESATVEVQQVHFGSVDQHS